MEQSPPVPHPRHVSHELRRPRPQHARGRRVAPHRTDRAGAAVPRTEPDSHALRILNGLITTDKHQLVHSTVGVMRLDAREPSVKITLDPKHGAILHRRAARNRHLVDGADLIRVKLAPLATQPEVKMHGQIPFEIAFGDRALRGSALEEIEAYVHRFIDLFVGDFPT